MQSLFSGRGVALASITASGLMLFNQLLQLILPLITGEAVWDATQSLRFGLAFVAMFALLLALTGLYWGQAHVIGGLGLVGYLTALLGTVLVAGDWYEAFVIPELMDRFPEIIGAPVSGSVLVGTAVTNAAFAVGWLIFGFASYRARIFPRGASILMMLGGLVWIPPLVGFGVPTTVGFGAPTTGGYPAGTGFGTVVELVDGWGAQIPLAIAVGWIGLWLVRSGTRELQPARESAPAPE